MSQARKLNARIFVVQSGPRGERILKEIQEFLSNEGIHAGLYISKIVQTQSVIKSNLPQHRLYIQRREVALKFIEGVLPYSRVKRVELLDVWRFLKINPSIKKYLTQFNNPTLYARRKAANRLAGRLF